MLVLTGFISDSSKYIYVCVYIYHDTLLACSVLALFCADSGAW